MLLYHILLPICINCTLPIAQTSKHASKQASKHASMQAGRRAGRRANKQASSQASRQAGKQALGRHSVGAMPWRGLLENPPRLPVYSLTTAIIMHYFEILQFNQCTQTPCRLWQVEHYLHFSPHPLAGSNGKRKDSKFTFSYYSKANKS